MARNHPSNELVICDEIQIQKNLFVVVLVNHNKIIAKRSSSQRRLMNYLKKSYINFLLVTPSKAELGISNEQKI